MFDQFFRYTQNKDFGSPDSRDDSVSVFVSLVESFTSRTQEDIKAAQARAIATLKPDLPPEPGKTAMEYVYEQWPGEETDEQIEQALKDLS